MSDFVKTTMSDLCRVHTSSTDFCCIAHTVYAANYDSINIWCQLRLLPTNCTADTLDIKVIKLKLHTTEQN